MRVLRSITTGKSGFLFNCRDNNTALAIGDIQLTHPRSKSVSSIRPRRCNERENPKWQRSQVKRLFADERYLAHRDGELDLGAARAEQPVTNVSWFAAKAFAAFRGKRLPALRAGDRPVRCRRN